MVDKVEKMASIMFGDEESRKSMIEEHPELVMEMMDQKEEDIEDMAEAQVYWMKLAKRFESFLFEFQEAKTEEEMSRLQDKVYDVLNNDEDLKG